MNRITDNLPIYSSTSNLGKRYGTLQAVQLLFKILNLRFRQTFNHVPFQVLLVKESLTANRTVDAPLPVRVHVFLQLPNGVELCITYFTFVKALLGVLFQNVTIQAMLFDKCFLTHTTDVFSGTVDPLHVLLQAYIRFERFPALLARLLRAEVPTENVDFQNVARFTGEIAMFALIRSLGAVTGQMTVKRRLTTALLSANVADEAFLALVSRLNVFF